jgi:acetyltransferase-like isoleucine patch superfamily enzyme
MSEPMSPTRHGIPENRFNAHAWIIGEPKIGDRTWIGAFTVIDGSGGLEIGSNCDISCGVQIYTHSTVHRVISEGTYNSVDRQSTRIGDFCHIGANAVVLMGCDISDHCVVAAGAVVLENTKVPPFSVVVGVPGRIIEGAALKWKPA